MQTIVDNVNYVFIPSKVVSFDNIKKIKKILSNDIYEKYKACTKVYGELIVCQDSSKITNRQTTIKKETYEEYLEYLNKRDPKKDTWIYNIIDGTHEQDSILYRDDKCVVIPTYTWDAVCVMKLHVLCIPTDITLRTIRSLEKKHIPLLEHMKEVTLKVIETKFNLNRQNVKTYFHYNPSTYHLHIHFVNTMLQNGSSVEHTHDLDSVIFNLSICDDYYKKIKLNTLL